MSGSARRLPMSRDQVDRTLAGLVAGYDRISAAMYELDSHPGLNMLRGGGLGGRTERVGVDLLARSGVLWSHFAALGATLDRARTVRAQRPRPGDDELAELTRLLREPVVRLDALGMALDDTAAGSPVAWLSLAELAQRLEAASVDLIRALADVAAAGQRLVAQFAPVSEALGRLRSDVAGLGAEALPVDALERISERLADVHQLADADPLGAVGGQVAATIRGRLRELTAELDTLAVRLTELTRLRAGYPARVAALRAVLDEVGAAQAQTGRTYAVVLEKIAEPGLPAIPDAVPALAAHLAQLDQMYREQRWARLAEELTTVERGAAAARDRATDLHEAADGLLRRRAELRGRLDAYRAKAGRLGLIEHAELAARHRAARDLLYTSPCDLPAATRAVMAYQRYLNDLTERPTPGRREPDD